MGRIPEWLEPYLRANSYNPIKEDIVNLEPQSREEMLLKYIAFYSSGGGDDYDRYFVTSDDEDFVDFNDRYFIVTN